MSVQVLHDAHVRYSYCALHTFIEVSECVFSHSLSNGDGCTQGDHIPGVI